MTLITDQAANKRRNAQLLVSGDKGVVCDLTFVGERDCEFQVEHANQVKDVVELTQLPRSATSDTRRPTGQIMFLLTLLV